MFWIRADRSLGHGTGIAVAAGSACGQASSEPGFCLEIGQNFVRALLNGELREKACLLDMTCPGELVGKWNHVAFTVDPEAGHLCLWLNFGRPYSWGFPKEMAMLEGGKLFIGRDILGYGEKRLPAVLDDLCLCGRSLTLEDVARLKEYYQA